MFDLFNVICNYPCQDLITFLCSREKKHGGEFQGSNWGDAFLLRSERLRTRHSNDYGLRTENATNTIML